MGKIEKRGSHAKGTKGGLRTMPFIFANEVGEKLAVVGFGTNMISYLTLQLNMPITQAANTLTNFGGTASLTPLLGAFISDSYAGKFWTIAVASLFYQIGMTCLTISAILPNLRPPQCHPNQVCQQATSFQVAILYAALLLNAIGAGGIRPCCVAFGADQFDSNQEKKTWKFFNWYYFCMGVSMLVAVTVIVYIQDNIGWGWGLGIPTGAMFFSIVTFIFGYPLYKHVNPAGSPFTRLIQVCVAAFKKRNSRQVSDPSMLYENQVLDESISVAGRLLHSKNLSCRISSGDQFLIDFGNGHVPKIRWKVGLRTTIHHFKGFHADKAMICRVNTVFVPCHKTIPILRPVASETPKIVLQREIDHFCLGICLGMINGTRTQLCPLELKNFQPK